MKRRVYVMASFQPSLKKQSCNYGLHCAKTWIRVYYGCYGNQRNAKQWSDGEALGRPSGRAHTPSTPTSAASHTRTYRMFCRLFSVLLFSFKVTGREKEKEIRNSDNICPGLGLWWFGGWRGREGERGREEVKDLLKWFNYEKCVTKSPVSLQGLTEWI